MKLIAIIAGNKKEAGEYAAWRQAKEGYIWDDIIVKGNQIYTKDYWLEMFYVISPEHLRGLRNVEFVYVGTWYARKDIDEIKELEMICNREMKCPDCNCWLCNKEIKQGNLVCKAKKWIKGITKE